MDVHPQHRPPGSFYEFCREYAMIVLSILTALGLERVAVYMHDRAAAERSRARIEQEIGEDLAALRTSLKFNDAHLASMREALSTLEESLGSPTSDPAQRKQTIEAALRSQMSLQLPVWQRQAWDAAVADQSASHLDAGDLQRYADLYTSATGAVDAVRLVLNGAIFDRMADLSVDLRLGEVDGRDAARLMARFVAAAQQITAVQQQLLQSGDDGKKAAAK